jgi:hypothetical protein
VVAVTASRSSRTGVACCIHGFEWKICSEGVNFRCGSIAPKIIRSVASGLPRTIDIITSAALVRLVPTGETRLFDQLSRASSIDDKRGSYPCNDQ